MLSLTRQGFIHLESYFERTRGRFFQGEEQKDDE